MPGDKLTDMALPPRILIMMYHYPNGVREARLQVPSIGMGQHNPVRVLLIENLTSGRRGPGRD
jgi:hypothetical protein